MLRKSSTRSKAEEAQSMCRGSRSRGSQFWDCSKIPPATPWDLSKCKMAGRGFLNRLFASSLELLELWPLLYRHQDWTPLVLDHEDQEFCRAGFACIPTHDINIVGTFVKRLPWR